jgi:hypothetical protein
MAVLHVIEAEDRTMDFTYSSIAKMIDHSLLQPTLTDEELEAGCRLAREYDVASVCIKPYYLRSAARGCSKRAPSRPAPPSVSPTAGTGPRSKWKKPNWPWTTAARNWTPW